MECPEICLSRSMCIFCFVLLYFVLYVFNIPISGKVICTGSNAVKKCQCSYHEEFFWGWAVGWWGVVVVVVCVCVWGGGGGGGGTGLLRNCSVKLVVSWQRFSKLASDWLAKQLPAIGSYVRKSLIRWILTWILLSGHAPGNRAHFLWVGYITYTPF